MYTLTEEELKRIVSWNPYRKDWPVDRNFRDDKIEEYFGDLMRFFEKNSSFECYVSEDGGISNYLEFILYPNNKGVGKAEAIMLCISLCAPIAAYGVIGIYKEEKSFGWGSMKAETVGVIESEELKSIEQIFLPLVKRKGIEILNAEEASTEISSDIYNNENCSISLREGNQLIHALFQLMD